MSGFARAAAVAAPRRSAAPALAALGETGWLADTPEPFRAAALARCVAVTVGRGESLRRAGDRPGGLWGLATGAIVVEAAPAEAEPWTADLLAPGAWFGEEGLAAGRRAGATLRAAKPCVLAHLPAASWEALAAERPDAWRWLALLAARNQQRTARVADTLALRSGISRVAALLLRLGEGGPQGAPFSVEIGQEAVAAMAGLSRSSLGRALSEFERIGAVTCEYRRLKILSPQALRAMTARIDD